MNEFAVRGSIFHTTANPTKDSDAWTYLNDGLMVVVDGRIKQVTPADECILSIENAMPVYEYPECLICPGFIDTHIHYAQTRIVGSPAPGLLEWLENHTFPEELQFGDSDYASQVAVEFLDELLRNGTTSALAYPTVHADSCNLFFEESHRRGLRMLAGKVLMNRNAPAGLLDGEDFGMGESERLIQKWHGNGRQSYAITLRFAGTSTVEQMKTCTELVNRYPDMLFHTHLSETLAEIEWVLGLYPEYQDYLAIYEEFGLVSEHSIFAHCIHLSESECERLADLGSTASLCPTSNLFLGSGLAQPNLLADHGIPISLGTDVGGGTSFSMLQTMQEMYKVARLGGANLDAFELFYLATLGGARALHIDDHLGSFKSGKEADFVVLDSGGRKLTQQKLERSNSIEELLFTYVILGSAQNVKETWSMGRRLYQRSSDSL